MEENKNTAPEDLENEEVAEEEEKVTEAEEAEVKETAAEEEKTSGKDKKKYEKLEAEIEKLNATLAEEQDKYMRLYAEYDNFRKRSSKERDGIYTDAVSDTIKEILPVIDNLERASLYSDAQKVAEGLKLTAKGAAAMLSKLGITEFAKEGEHFDPNLHNAVMHVEDEDLGEGVIVEVFQKGYRRGDKIIRYAMVKVAN